MADYSSASRDLSSAIINNQLNPAYVVLGEVQNVIAAMRLNTRWSSRSKRGKEGPLLSTLMKLRKRLETEPDDFAEMDILDVMRPFLDVIRSEKTTGPITGVALSSVYKFLQYGFLSIENKGAIQGIEEIGAAVTHCRFEGTDPETDEVVLTKILNVLRKCVQIDVGAIISDQLVYDMVQTCFKMSIQMHLSVLLRKSAELALMEIVQHVFGMYESDRKKEIEDKVTRILLSSSPEVAPPASPLLQSQSAPDSPMLSRSTERSSSSLDASGAVVSPPVAPEAAQPGTPPVPQEMAFTNPQGVRFDVDEESTTGKLAPNSAVKPFGLPVLIKLFRFFCSIINPHYANNTETMRFLGLALVNAVLEIRSKTIEKTPKLLELVKDDLSKFLLQSLGSTDNVSIMTLALRVAFNLFISLRHKLKFQMELFFSYIFGLFQHADEPNVGQPSASSTMTAGPIDEQDANAASGTAEVASLAAPTPSPALRGEGSVPYEHLEIALETLVQLCADPDFLVDMYMTYDCDLNSSNLFGKLADFLYRTSYPHNGQLLSINLLALDGLLAILYSVANRFNQPPALQSSDRTSATSVTAEQLKEKKSTKNILLAGAENFNRKPKDGIKFLLEKKVLPSPPDAAATAHFFKTNKWINKTKLGEYFGEPDDFNVECLKQFISLTNYNGRRFVDVVREFLESFRLPGEAPKIERIMDLFSRDYYEREKGIFANVDAAYLASFSIVMLNVDLYNPNVPAHRKMTMESYAKNLRGTNGGVDFPPEWLSENFNSIKDNEIKIPEEHLNTNQISNATWRYLLGKYDNQDAEVSGHVESGVYDKFLFSLTWRQIHAAVRSVFAVSTDSELTEQLLQALLLSGEICAHFSLHHAFDNLIITLGELSSLVAPAGTTPYADKMRYVQFSRNKRAQMATTALFELARSFPTQMREGWKTITYILLNVRPILKLPLLERDDIFKLPKNLLADEPAPEKAEATSAASPIFGLMTSIWPFGGGSNSNSSSNASDSLTDEDDSDNEHGAGADAAASETPREKLRRLMVQECRVGELLSKTSTVDFGSLDHVVKSLITASTPKWTKTPKKTNGTPSSGPTPKEVASAVFALDVLTDIILCNETRLKMLWQHVHEHFEKLLVGLTSPNALTNKAILNLLYLAAKLIPAVATSNAVVTEQILNTLHLLPKMSEENIVFYSERINVAFAKVLLRSAEFVKGEQLWSSMFGLAKWTLQFPKFVKDTFDSIVYVVSPFRYQQKQLVMKQQQLKESGEASPSLASSATYSRTFSFVTSSNFAAALDTVVSFGRLPACPMEVALESLELLQSLVCVVPSLVGISLPSSMSSSTTTSLTGSASIPNELLVLDTASEQRALDNFIVPLFLALNDRTRDHRVLVRHHAMSHLQKALLAPEMAVCTSHSWLQIFDKVIFPLLVELLQPVTHDTPRDIVEETRLRASSILCKTFLHYMSKIEVPSFHMLWLKVLSFVEMYMKADNSELLAEAVTESLKNILLVMFASGLLAKPLTSTDGAPDPSGTSLWDLSWKTIDGFCPTLRREFMLKVYPPSEAAAPAAEPLPVPSSEPAPQN